MRFDLISDIHIDKWDTEFQTNWAKTKKSDICVIAGDISDNITQTVEELRELASLYTHVIFIEGNHEHQHYWPDFNFAPEYLKNKLSTITNVHYIYDDIFVLDKVAFIGKCGWWDFKFAEPLVSEKVGRDRFIQDKFDICDEIANKSNEEFQYLFDNINLLQFNSDIEKIVVVTHTAPLPKFISPGEYPPWPEYSAFQGNINMPMVVDIDFRKKIKAWVFGHNHDQKKDIYKGILFLSNPRGRPTDYNREVYFPIVIEI